MTIAQEELTMTRSNRILLAVLILSMGLLWAGLAACDQNCFSIVVGKDASADGWVIMGHNEDDGPPQIVNHHKVPRMKHQSWEKVKLLNGGELDQVDQTWSYIWSEMPGMIFSDSYVNEWGVCIASDNCPSREDKPELTDGGISYNLRRLIAERAKTAREGVELAGDLLKRFGYDASGRTYVISDPTEGWFFCAVNGKHWLAARVPDDGVAVVTNSYAVHQVNLTDTLNYLSSGDIIEYAVKRGWYDPEEDGPFDFASVYADPWAASDSGNFCRQWAGLRYVAEEALPLQPDLPFSVKPVHKLGVADLTAILRDHYEGTGLYQADPESGSPHETGINSICNGTTQTSFVVQLRKDLPLEIGIVYWLSLGRPCLSFYIPVHFGSYLPHGYYSRKSMPSGEYYQERLEAPFQIKPLEPFWTFNNFCLKADAIYNRPDLTAFRKVDIGHLERKALAFQKAIEKAALEFASDQSLVTVSEFLVNYTDGLYLQALESLRGHVGE